MTLEEKEALRVKLEDVIVTVLRRYPALSYFQGYHDVRNLLHDQIQALTFPVLDHFGPSPDSGRSGVIYSSSGTNVVASDQRQLRSWT